MEIVFSDGKTLEIERKLGCTVFLPQKCYFKCGELITKFGRESESLCFHSLDENHQNWDPFNKCPSHRGCHQSYHIIKDERMVGDKNPMKDPEISAKHGEIMTGEKGTERAKKAWPTRRDRHGQSGFKDPEAHGRAVSEGQKKAGAGKKGWDTRRRRYPASGYKDPEAFGRSVSEGMKKTNAGARSWDTRRARYGPTGRKPKEKGL